MPLLEASPGLRAVALYEEMMRRHPELLRKRFPPKPDGIPDVATTLPPVADYDDLGAPALAAGGLS